MHYERAFRFALAAAVVVALGASAASAQSLGELAKKEAERRAKLKEKGVQSVVVTNESLDRYKGIALNEGSSGGDVAPRYSGYQEFNDGDEAPAERQFSFEPPPEGYVSPPFEPEIVDDPEGPRGAQALRGGGGETPAESEDIAERETVDISESDE